MNKLNGVMKEYCMEVSLKKAKGMCITQKGKSKVCPLIDDQQVEQISRLTCLEIYRLWTSRSWS